MATLRERLAGLPEVVTVDDLAVVFDVNRQTIWRWLRSGHLPGIRVGRTWRLYRDDILEAIAKAPSPASTTGQISGQTPGQDLSRGRPALPARPENRRGAFPAVASTRRI